MTRLLDSGGLELTFGAIAQIERHNTVLEILVGPELAEDAEVLDSGEVPVKVSARVPADDWAAVVL